ncbi:DNA invertase Pin-like site-specific DNA recombinase [Phycicoccus badiiscoriae]|uniref:DNA invertase Pin-like site-specific DNA recombinase n=1 Tax=Pedococcus badiiscoriae TaxID=642776 RepID=A0A852WG91_9MICO|nr:recombinase family protein [Pedococcus badiiscoriae]NYG07810.1 DNA invertase Pin-like site-specific DNA recombinase [Pedococcus badiiscoriae]
MGKRTAAIYVRISSDPEGTRLGVTRQLRGCEAKAADMGWVVGEVFEDNDVSASSTKPRPAYERMLAALEAGEVDAVVVWDLDRLTRRPIEIEHFIDLADRKRVALASVGGDVDLATDNGRMFARIKGAVARAEVERKSARQRAASDQRAENGAPHRGRRAFGFEPDGVTVREEEAAEVKRAAGALLGGASLRGIVVELTARGVTTTTGGTWRPTELRRMLANPRYAGLRVHRGEVVGDAGWPAILDSDTWVGVGAILSDPSRRRPGRPRRHLLSGVARCAVCGGRIFGTTEPRGPVYMCETRRHVVRRGEPVDQLVVATVVGRLSMPDAAGLFARREAEDETAQLVDDERRLRQRLDGLAEAYAAGDIDGSQLAAGSRRLKAELSEVTAALARTARSPALGRLVTAADVQAAWDALHVDNQREVLRVLLDVTLEPIGRGRRTFDPATVGMTWKDEAIAFQRIRGSPDHADPTIWDTNPRGRTGKRA